MNPLTVRTLGVPEVRYQGKKLAFRSRKALALLIYLTVESGAHSREKLINLFWAASDARQGRVSLRTALSQVRQALRVTGSSGIVATNDLVRLDLAPTWQLDLNLIADALQPEATAAEWQAAANANNGPFLEGFSLSEAPGFDEWVSYQRQRSHSQMEYVYQHLTTYQLDRGEGLQAVRTARQWVVHSPLNETAYCSLMEAQARTGDRAAALQTYERCQRALLTDLDLAAGPEITSLAERIRQGEIRKQKDDSASFEVRRPSPFPFVGRASEYSQLATALRTAVQGTTVVKAVVGTAGMGKTHLVEAFLHGAQFGRLSVDVLRGRALATRRPVILFLDDWQWAEDSSLEMLQYLSQSWAETNAALMIVLTIRQEALLTTLALQEWLRGIERRMPVARVELAALEATDIQQFVRQMATTEAGDVQLHADDAVWQFSDWLYQETGGQPFFLHERVKMLVEQGILRAQEGESRSVFDISSAWQHLQSQKQLPLPTTVRQALLARQSRLGETATALLWASAVMGRDCTFHRLCQVASVAGLDGLPALGELLNGRFLLENESARRPYTFAHDYIREVAYTEAGEARRRLFHRRALVALEQEQAPPAELAFHALAAQLDEPAFGHTLAAGDSAKQAHAYSEAVAYYDQALALAQAKTTLRVVDGELMRQLYTNRGRALELDQQFEAAQDNYEEMIELAAERSDPAMRLAGLISQCIMRATQTPLFNLREARILAEEALALAQQLGDEASEAKVLWGLLLVEAFGDGDNPKALAFGLRSLELSRALRLKEQMAFTHQDMAYVYRYLNRLADAERANQAALEIWQELGNLPMLVDAYTMQHLNHFMAGELESSLAFAEEALRLSGSINHAWGQVVSLGFLAGILTELGDPARTAEALHQRERITTAVGSGFHITYQYLIHSGWLALALSLGVWADVVQLGEEIYENRHNLIPVFSPYMMDGLIQLKVLEGNLEQARQIWDEISPSATEPSTRAELYILLAQNDFQAALERAEEIAERYRQIGYRGYLPEVLWLQARARIGLGQWAQAHDTLTEALNVSQRNGERRLRWRILSSLAEIATVQGKQNEADGYRKMGHDVTAYIASHIDNAELRAAFLATKAVQKLLPAGA